MENMTVERAIEILEQDNRSLSKGVSPNNPIGRRAIEEISANNTAIIALGKQIPMQATYVYDDEFICPACSYEDDGYDVKMLKVCPECGQKIKWS